MVKNPKLLEKFNDNYIKSRKISYKKALKIYESLWHEAVSLGILPSKNPLDNLESQIKIAKALNFGKK